MTVLLGLAVALFQALASCRPRVRRLVPAALRAVLMWTALICRLALWMRPAVLLKFLPWMRRLWSVAGAGISNALAITVPALLSDRASSQTTQKALLKSCEYSSNSSPDQTCPSTRST